MIVNPQLFSYRLIIGSLVIAIVILGSFSHISYNTLKKNQMVIEQEKALVESELSEMISSYKTVDVENDSIAKRLEETKSKITTILDSVKLLKPNASLISIYKVQIKLLKEENMQLFAAVDNLQSKNAVLNLKAQSNATGLEQSNTIASALKSKNKTLVVTNLKFKEDLVKAKQFTITNIVAEGVKRVTTSSRIINTENVNKTNKFHVCFTLVKNEQLEKGPKDLYIQILDSKMNVVADKGTLNFGKTSLIYSAKTIAQYTNEDLEICLLIDKGAEKLTKGAYFVSIFYQGKKLGRTIIQLK